MTTAIPPADRLLSENELDRAFARASEQAEMPGPLMLQPLVIPERSLAVQFDTHRDPGDERDE